MNPVMVHADGTDCRHEGVPQATVHEDSGPLCPAGRPVTHVRFNGKEMTLEEAQTAFRSLVDDFNRAFTPLIAAFGEACQAVGSALVPSATERSKPR